MGTFYYISLNLRTLKGFESFGRFDLGCDRDFAYGLFASLAGTTHVKEADSLIMELMETKAGLPFNLKIISCTLDELSDNCRHLTKELFRSSLSR